MRSDLRRRKSRLNKKRRKDLKKGRIGGRAKQWRKKRAAAKKAGKKMAHKPLVKPKTP